MRNSAEVVGQVGNLRRVGNPPERLVNSPAGAGCQPARRIPSCPTINASTRQTLIADQNVVAAFDHVSGAAAVLVPVTQAVRFQVVDEDGGTSIGGDPGVGPAAPGVNAGIGDAQRGPAVHIHVGRPGFGGSDAFVRATRPMVRVLRHQGAIAEPGLFWHSTLSNISRGDRGQMPWR
jgi:hypothetical protein